MSWYSLKTIWLFTVSDHKTFVLPETLFGTLGALSGPVLLGKDSLEFPAIMLRLPATLCWTWLNTFVFVLSNQGSVSAIEEDTRNKPWRPLAAGRLSLEQARICLSLAIPTVLLFHFFVLGAWQETVILFSLTWVYNDLGGSDRSFIVRNLIIAVAYAFYGSGALRTAAGIEDQNLTNEVKVWLGLTSGVIFTTMSVQDLKDQEGDRCRAKCTAPLVVGEMATRRGIAFAMLFWSLACPLFWRMGPLFMFISFICSIIVAARVLVKRGYDADRLTWKLWSYWLIGLYCLPVCKRYSA